MDERARELRPTERFTDRAGEYVRFRPDYPAAAIERIVRGLAPGGGRKEIVAADVGAGTGISARMLAERGLRVKAVEPNAAMRAAIEPRPGVEPVDGAAEATGLPDASVDLVLAAQAWHWFDHPRALAEFRRILAPGGRLAVLVHITDERDPMTGEYVRIVSNPGVHDKSAYRWETILAGGLFEREDEAKFTHAQTLDEGGLIGRAMSASYVPREGPQAEAIKEQLRAAWERWRDVDGRVSLVYRTCVFLARAG